MGCAGNCGICDLQSFGLSVLSNNWVSFNAHVFGHDHKQLMVRITIYFFPQIQPEYVYNVWVIDILIQLRYNFAWNLSCPSICCILHFLPLAI